MRIKFIEETNSVWRKWALILAFFFIALRIYDVLNFSYPTDIVAMCFPK